MSRIEDVIQVYWNEWNGRFSLVTKTNKTEMIPVLLGKSSNIVVCGDEFGHLYVWKSPENVKENVGGCFNGHSSLIQKVGSIGKYARLLLFHP